MILGAGVDIVEIFRMKDAVKRWGEEFLTKIFTPREIKYSNSKKFPYQHLAGRFAAKEAVFKALGDALLDFKKGLELFSKRLYEQSYFSIKKAHIKFKSESRVNLTLETNFFLGSILSHLNKFKPAINYFRQLEELSRQLKHQKYFETSIFMQAFVLSITIIGKH